MNNAKIIKIELHEPHIIKRKSEIEQERNIAIADLLRDNYFALPSHDGPYEMSLQNVDCKLKINISGENITGYCAINIATGQFRSIIKDYFIICESYFAASSNKDPYRLETIDMSRRATHNEGAELFKKLLEQQASLDFNTARRLFTLMCVMQVK